MRHASDEGSPGTQGAPGSTVLGRYRIEKTLGQGGMGEVLLAQDTLLNRRVALKRMLSTGADHAELRRSILREARRASQINDPHVAAIYDVLDLRDQVVLVMEYVDGVTLRERMADPVAIETFWSLAEQCVGGLAAAHAHGVIHRDIKPENLMVTRGGQVKILDFGVAKRATTSMGPITTSIDSLAESIVGTPLYMAPEAHLGDDVDERADIFALGVVFYELLTAKRPFEGSTYGAVIDSVLRGEPTPVSDLNPEAGPGLSSVVSRMLAKRPADRIATPAEVMRQLTLARRGEALPAPAVVVAPAAAPARVAPAPRSRPDWVIPTVTAIAIAIAAAAALLWRTLAPPPLPVHKNVALLAPQVTGDDAFTPFAFGAIDVLSTRLRRQTTAPNFQLASYPDAVEQKIRSAADARKILGVNLALTSTVEQAADTYRARLDLIDTASGKRIATRAIQSPAAQPFVFLDQLHEAAAAMLGLPADSKRPFDSGVRGAGTLRFQLQGLGRMRTSSSIAEMQAAAGDFETACRMEPESAVARAGLSSAQLKLYYLATSDTASLIRSVATAREAIALDPARPEPHRALASALATQRKPAEALPEYARVCELDPTDDEASLRLARMYFRLGQPDREAQVYRATIERRSHCWQPYWWLATWNFRRGDIDDAVRNFREMVRRSPDFGDGYASLGGILVLRGEYGAAIDTLKRSIELRPSRNAFDNLGTAYFNLGRGPEAVEAYNQSFQFGEAGYQTWSNLGDAYAWLQGRDEDAAKSYQKAIQMAREEILTRSQQGHSVDYIIPAQLAVLFARVGEPDSARLYLDRAVSGDGANTMVQYEAALTRWQLGEKDEAMGWMEKSVRGGYPTAWLRDSPMFREWRELPAFRALVGEPKSQPQQAASSS